MFLWANLLGTLVKFWNFNLGKLLLGILGNPLRIPSWEHLVNFGKISIWENFVKFGILFGKILLLSMFVEQNFGKFYLGNFSPCWQCFDLGVFAWENLFKILLWKTLFSPDQHGGLTDGQLRGRIVRKSPCLWHFCFLVTLSHLVRKICFMKASLILSLAGHSLFVIGFVLILDHIFAFTGGTEMSSSFVPYRG